MLLLLLCLQGTAAIDAAAGNVAGMDVAKWSLVDDAGFLARVTQDLWGETPLDPKAFVDDRTPDKRARKIDELLASPKFAAHWGRKLAVWLIGKPEDYRAAVAGLSPKGERAIADAFVDWMIAGAERPWTDTVKALIEARGETPAAPELAWKLGFTARKDPHFEVAVDLADRFLGIRLGCAACHDHPFDRWRMEDAYGLAAFTRRYATRALPGGLGVEWKIPDQGEMLLPLRNADADAKVRMSSGGEVPPVFFFGGKAEKNDDRLVVLSKLMTSTSNTQLPRAFANRVWAWLFGKGVVDPPDDFGLRNKPVSPVLLDGLVKTFVDGGTRLKPLLRAILHTRIYQNVDLTDPAKAEWSSFRGLLVKPPLPPKNPFGTWKLVLPPEWTPTGIRVGPGMRYRVPGTGGPASFATANQTELAGQFLSAKPVVEKIEGPVTLTVTDVAGTYTCDPTSRAPRENWRIVDVAVQKGQTLRRFRLEGPKETVAEWRDRFVELLRKAEIP